MTGELRERLRALLLARRWRRDLDEEMQFHLEQDAAARVRGGASEAEARVAARRAFGGVERWKDATHDASGARPLAELGRDLRFAMRAVARNPGFSLTVVLVLGTAIGTAAVAWRVVDTVLLRELPFPHGERLVRIYQQNSPTNRWSLSTVDVQAIAAEQRSFDAFGAAGYFGATLAGAGTPEQVEGTRVSAGLLAALSIAPATGRGLVPADEAPDAPPVTLVTHAFARDRLGGDQAAVGRTLVLDDRSYTVVGVLPRGTEEFAGMRGPFFPALQLATPTRRGPFGLHGIGRLRDGVTLEDAAQDLTGISARVFPPWRAAFQDSTARLTPYALRRTLIGDAGGQVWLFAAAVALVFLVAIANVATLTLVRASARETELTVRAVLGAPRFRLARLVIVECLVLTGFATLLGAVIAAGGTALVVRVAPGLPRLAELGAGGPGLLVLLVLGLTAGTLVSIVPVVSVLSGVLSHGRADALRSGGARHRQRLRGLLVAAEFALAVPLLLTAALLARSLAQLQRVDPGFDAARSFSVAIGLPASRYPDYPEIARFRARALALVAEVPGVEAVGISTTAPPDNQGDVNNFNLVSHPVPAGSAEPVAPWAYADAGFFAALQIPLLRGRLFTAADTGNTPPVAVVSRSWAEHYFPREEVLGQQLVEGGCYDCPRTTIVGVVGDVKYQGLQGGGEGVYVSLEQTGMRYMTLFVRTHGGPAPVIAPVVAVLRGLDPALPLSGAPMRDRMAQAFADPGRWTAVLTGFGLVALLLAAVGIFGLVSFVVRRQRREIGVRIALGAEPARVSAMIARQGLAWVTGGTAVGVVIALACGRFLESLLFQVRPADPLTFLVVLALLGAAAVVACGIPALRAARIEPAIALREE